MNSSYISLILFFLITIYYFIGLKLPLSVDILTNDKLYAEYNTSNNYYLIIYFLLVVLSQFAINSNVIINKCGGSVSQNIGVAALMTFIPWILIFGVVIVILIMMPGFKSAFSNVIGYFVVSSSANEILTTLLVDTNISDQINKSVNDQSTKEGLTNAAEAIIKICGNVSIFINEITPTDFMEYWTTIVPLMKEKYTKTAEGKTELIGLQKQLLDVVVRRDNIGEALWYIYTAVLLTSIIQYNLTTRGCVKDAAAMEASHQQFLEQEAANKAANEKAKSMVYTISS